VGDEVGWRQDMTINQPWAGLKCNNTNPFFSDWIILIVRMDEKYCGIEKNTRQSIVGDGDWIMKSTISLCWGMIEFGAMVEWLIPPHMGVYIHPLSFANCWYKQGDGRRGSFGCGHWCGACWEVTWSQFIYAGTCWFSLVQWNNWFLHPWGVYIILMGLPGTVIKRAVKKRLAREQKKKKNWCDILL